MRTAALIAVLALVGCSKVKKAGEYVGITPDPPAPTAPAETPEEKVAREKIEREAKIAAEKAEKERIVNEKKNAVAALKEGDALVQEWADKLGEKQPNGGFRHHEGITEQDPWGNLLKVEYQQKWFTEYLTVTSAGPDSKYGTPDDLVRTRSVSNPGGIGDGISTFGWVMIVWLGSAALSVWFSSSLISRHNRLKGKVRREHPLGFALAVMVMGPLALIFYGLKLAANILGEFNGHPGWGLSFDFDLDFGDFDIL